MNTLTLFFPSLRLTTWLALVLSKSVPSTSYLKIIVLFIATVIMTTQTLADGAIGMVNFSRGSCAAQQADQPARLIGKGAEIFQGDNIQTAERSFVIIAFNDGSKVTVRPNSSFSVNSFSNQAGQERAKMELHIGGVHASTGKIAESKPENYEIKTSLGTVKTKKSDYSVRLCDKDCEQDNQAAIDAGTKTAEPVAARAVEVKNIVIAKNTATETAQDRQLAIGSPIYSSDQLNSFDNAYATLVFRDGGRITLQANSEFKVSEYQFNQSGKEDRAIFRLITGGLRALTGTIGKTNKAAYQVDTAVASIGIRGTGFDLVCGAGCSDARSNFTEELNFILNGKGSGLYSRVWQGGIDQNNSVGQHILDKGKANYIASINSLPVEMPQIPAFMQSFPAPRPDAIKLNIKQLFAPDTAKGGKKGLYVSVQSGEIELQVGEERSKTIRTNESGFIDADGTVIKLDAPEPFQLIDDYPQPSNFIQTKTNLEQHSQLTRSDKISKQQVYECTVK